MPQRSQAMPTKSVAFNRTYAHSSKCHSYTQGVWFNRLPRAEKDIRRPHSLGSLLLMLRGLISGFILSLTFLSIDLIG